MNGLDFEMISSLLRERSGLVLTSDKGYLLESRLTPVARKNELGDLNALLAKVRSGASEDLLVEITEAMTTNESFFFRDKTPFDILQKTVLPALNRSTAASKRLRIWCAAASTGQEPYSIAMILNEQAVQWKGWTIEILGTDLSAEVLRKARQGVYSQFEVQRGLPIQLLVKYFQQDGDVWRINENIRNMVTYKPFNLLGNFASMGRFDIVFCRNVLIYFDMETKGHVLQKLDAAMPENGSLFLGAAETVLGVTDKFKPVRGQRGLYAPARGITDEAPASRAAG